MQAEQLLEFINKSHSVFHGIKLVEEELKDAGFVKLEESKPWKLENNRYYYVTRNDSSIIAFKIPEMLQVKSMNIVLTHSDSPTFKLKPVSEMSDHSYNKLNVEAYGGFIYSSWFDRPLSVAGRVVVNHNGTLISRLVDIDEDYCIIPNVAIHQNRNINEGYKYNPQVDTIPLVGDSGNEQFLLKKLANGLNVNTNDILGYDLFLYNRQKGYIWGDSKQYVSCGKLDDLECTYGALQAFKYSYSERSINMFVVLDNEEVGSESRQGANSPFVKDVIDRIFASFFYSPVDYKTVLANSFMISADNAHALHPNHPELFDNTNYCLMNKGIVIKRNASQRYATDGQSEAIMRMICQQAQVPYQFFANRSDSRGGGTQASTLQSSVSIMSVDIGLAQLAMHSSFETAGSYDLDYYVKALSQFYSKTIIVDKDKIEIK